MSRVDVVIPCYKYAHFLPGCVESVLSQKGVDVRALIIDDCSPDNTEEVARGLAAADTRVEYRRHAVNQGHIATYNEGLLGWASAEYSLLLSADDMLIPGALARAVGLMDDHPAVGLTYGREIRTGRPRFGAHVPPERCGWRILRGVEFIELSCREADNIVPTPSAVVRTRVQQAIGGYRAELPHSGDMEMWLRFAVHSAVGVIDAEQAYYRVHGQNMCRGYAGMNDLLAKRAAFETLFREYGDRIPEADRARLRDLAARRLAEMSFWTASRRFEAGDDAGCQERLDFALRVYPGLQSRPEWSRLARKRMVGRRIWCLVAPLVRRLRRPRVDPALTPGSGPAAVSAG